MTTLDLMTLIAAFLWGLVSAAIGAWAMARAQRRRQPPPVLPAPKPITTTEALKLAANFLAPLRYGELSPEEQRRVATWITKHPGATPWAGEAGPEKVKPWTPSETYPQFFARTAEETGVLPPSRAPDSPTPPTEGQDTNQTPGDALRATGISVEDIDPTAVKRAIWGTESGYAPDAAERITITADDWDFAPLPHTYEPDPTINVPTCTHCGKWPSHHHHTTGDTQ